MPRTLVFGMVSVVLMAGAVACSAAKGGDACQALTVAVAPEIAPVVDAAASGGECKITVVAQEPGKVADILSGTLESRIPDVWIPDSSLWIAPARRTPDGEKRVPEKGESLASSPVVWGIPAPLAMRLARSKQKPSWRQLLPSQVQEVKAVQGPTLAVPDPGRSAVGMATLIATQQLAGKGKPGLQRYATALLAVRTLAVKDVNKAVAGTRPTIGVMSEQAALATKMVVANPAEGTLSLDYPYLVTTGDPAKAKAAAAFGAGLAKADFTKLGFRTRDGRPGPDVSALSGVDVKGPKKLAEPDPEKTAKIRKIWNRVLLGARLLDVLDVSPSMAQTVPGTSTTRLDALTRQMLSSFALTPEFVSIGLWEFSTRLNGTTHHREVVPIRKVGAPVGDLKHRDVLIRKLSAAKPVPGTYTGLYDTILAAFREVKKAYQPDVYNTVLIFTDGLNQNPYGGLTLARLVRTLKAEFDPKAPISVVIAAYGPDIKPGPLQQIADATRGAVYISKDARQTQRIFQDLLVRMLCNGAECPVNS